MFVAAVPPDDQPLISDDDDGSTFSRIVVPLRLLLKYGHEANVYEQRTAVFANIVEEQIRSFVGHDTIFHLGHAPRNHANRRGCSENPSKPVAAGISSQQRRVRRIISEDPVASRWSTPR